MLRAHLPLSELPRFLPARARRQLGRLREPRERRPVPPASGLFKQHRYLPFSAAALGHFDDLMDALMAEVKVLGDLPQ